MYAAPRAVFSYAESAEYTACTPFRDIRLPRVALVDRPHLGADEVSDLAEALGANHAVMM
jgi:hypothetical protein